MNDINSSSSNSKFEMQFIDKLIVSMIGIANIIVIIITIVAVRNNYRRMYEEHLRSLNEIPYNETYKYLKKDNVITFYQDIKEVTKYECTGDCEITKFSSSQFIIDNDNLIPIEDNGKVNIYDINSNSSNSNAVVLDDIPQTSINNKYGIIKMDGKDGVINKHGRIALECIYNDIDINASHIVALGNNMLYVFDNNAMLIESKPITTTGDISISEKNNILYINIFGNQNTTFIFDTKTNKFTN